MGWCTELFKEEKFKTLSEEALRECLVILAPLADRTLELESGKWDSEKERVESLILGWHFSREGAERAVREMKNADGSVGQYWSVEDTQEVVKTMGLNLGEKRYNLFDLYYTLNMARSDFYLETRSPQDYVTLAFQILDDKDAPEGVAKRIWFAKHCLK